MFFSLIGRTRHEIELIGSNTNTKHEMKNKEIIYYKLINHRATTKKKESYNSCALGSLKTV